MSREWGTVNAVSLPAGKIACGRGLPAKYPTSPQHRFEGQNITRPGRQRFEAAAREHFKSAESGVTQAGTDPLSVFMGVAFVLMWSSAFSVAKLALVDAPPLLLLTARFALSGVLAVGIALALGQRLPANPRSLATIGMLGVCQNTIYLGLFFVAMTWVTAGVAAIVASTMPLMVAAASAIVFGHKLGTPGKTGLALGFGGVVYIMSQRLGGGSLDPAGLALCLVAVVALAGATLLVRHANLGTGLMMAVGLQMLVGSITLAPFAFALESLSAFRWTASLGLSFAYITLVPGIAATLVWFVLIRRIGAPRASAYHFLNPPFGVAIAWLMLGEAFGVGDIVGVAVVTAGILLVQRDSL